MIPIFYLKLSLHIIPLNSHIINKGAWEPVTPKGWKIHLESENPTPHLELVC